MILDCGPVGRLLDLVGMRPHGAGHCGVRLMDGHVAGLYDDGVVV